MDEVKDKVKGFMKKVNNPFSSSSSGKFQGQGRVLGSSSPSSSSSSSSSSSNLIASRQTNPRPSSNSTNSKPSPQKSQSSDQPRPDSEKNASVDRKPQNGFDPFGSLIASGKRSLNGGSLGVQCPICQRPFASEQEVSEHVESCVESEGAAAENGGSDSSPGGLEMAVCAYLSGNPAAGSVEVVLRLLGNIVREPDNAKFRRVRMGNPKIKEAVADAVGGIELLEFVGFELKVEEEDGEMWATMAAPGEEQIGLIRRAVQLLQSQNGGEPQRAAESPSSGGPGELKEKEKEKEKAEPKKIDRQTKVFFSVPESVAAKIELPDSFFNLSLEELKREAEMRKKKIADSQLLIPKTYKEKQAKAARKKYKKTMIRIQFPDGVVLQGVFNPWEPTSSLYKCVSEALKEPSLQFELLHPVVVKRRVIPCFPAAGKNPTTLDEEDLVPSALVKFRPIETDSVVFTGLRNELLEISEPLIADSPVAL